MHHQFGSLLITQPIFNTGMLSAGLEIAHPAVQRGSVAAAAAVAGTRRRRRRHTEPTVQQEPDAPRASSSNRNSTHIQPGECVLLYIPIKCETRALEVCRQAGYKLTDFTELQHGLPREVPANLLTAPTEPAPSRSTTTPQQAGTPAEKATGLGTTTGIAEQHQQHGVDIQTPLTPQHHQFKTQQATHHIKGEEAADEPNQTAKQPGAAALPTVQTPSTAEAAAPRAAWQIAVDRRVREAAKASSRNVSMARYNKWRGVSPTAPPASPRIMPSSAPSHRSSSSDLSDHFMPELQRGSSSSSAVALQQKYGSGQQLSPAAEAELCAMYQRYLALDQLVREEVNRHQQQQQQQHGQAGAAPVIPSRLDSASDVEVQGLMAQELLLELYRPLIYKRANAAARGAPGSDHGELVAAARRAVLQAASKFDAARAAANTARLATLADMYVRNAIKAVLQEYQAGVLSLPAHVLELSRKLQQIEDKHQRLHHSKPSVQELAAAAGVSALQAQRALAAADLQASGLSDIGGGDDDAEQRGAGVNLQLLDTTDAFEDLDSSVAQGAVKASRSGLQEEQEQAAQAELLASVMQQYLMKLSERDRNLLALRIGIRLPGILHSSTTGPADDQAGKSSKSDMQQQGGAGVMAGAAGVSGAEAVHLQDLVVEDQGVSLGELAKHFNVKSRQRAHQLMEGAVKQLRQQLQQAAEEDAKVAQLLAGSKLAK